ncbi:M28 family peptidase [Shewanella sp. JM162201]|uniref:M28 family peptidase n=1 Tax=Shewanella jiangmenensis TaxID=2837387 RepID=A0ABS5V0F9_9GAMM|nr:M28 family peptidase [Shewanella jiangmenensis]MBT1443949.1 M28 family peptidase [Shewanella jiangmenensis]
MRRLALPLLCMVLGACQSTPQCRRDLSPSWVALETVRADVEYLASKELEGRKAGSEGARLAREYVAQRFAAIGLIPVDAGLKPLLGEALQAGETGKAGAFFHPFTFEQLFSGREGVNVLGLLPASMPATTLGSTSGGRWRIVLAHYDHLGKQGSRHFAGADDNASGVAALLALAERAATDPARPADLNLLFVATDAEEAGLFGAKALAGRLTELGIRPELALNLDMVGHPGRPYAIYMEGSRNFTNPDELRALIERNDLCARLSHSRLEKDGLSGRIDYLKASDHYPFHQQGVPWLYFGVPPHPQYHTVDDTPERLDFGFLAATIEAVYPLLWHSLLPRPD